MSDKTSKHCDDYIQDFHAPYVLRFFLLINRMPAMDMALCHKMGVNPKLFADYKNKRVRVVMASRLGDIGITSKLDAEIGYETRVAVEELSSFSEKP